MNLKSFRYLVFLALTLLFGLNFIHPNLKITTDKDAVSDIVLSSHAQIAHLPLTTERTFALEIAEVEEREEEMRQVPDSEKEKHLLDLVPSALHQLFFGRFFVFSKAAYAHDSHFALSLPFRRYIKYQVFRL